MSLPHTNSGVRTLDILLPTGIAICAVLSLCTFVLCIRTRHKFYTVPPTRRNSSVIRRSKYKLMLYSKAHIHTHTHTHIN